MVLITTGESGEPHRTETFHRSTTAAIDNDPENHNHQHNLNNRHNHYNQNHNSRGKSLSSFTSLPCFNIKWGHQKSLRCVKDSDDNHHNELTRSEFDSVDGVVVGGRKRRRSNDDGGIKAMREKLMLDFSRQAAQMQAAFLNKSDVVTPLPPHSPEIEPRPWNLRTRRAVCKDPNNITNTNNNNNNAFQSSERKPSFSQAIMADVKSPAKRSGDVNSDGDGGGRAKFSRFLSKQEIEEDFLSIMGTRPVRRPKKRPRIVQRQIDAISPGFWLSEITADMYKVNEQV